VVNLAHVEPQLERVLEAASGLLRVQPIASLSQGIADGAVTIFGALGSALFLVARDDGVTSEDGVLSAVSGTCSAMTVGARDTTQALLTTTPPGTLAVPLQGDTALAAVLWIRAAWPEPSATERAVALRVFAPRWRLRPWRTRKTMSGSSRSTRSGKTTSPQSPTSFAIRSERSSMRCASSSGSAHRMPAFSSFAT
jgi:hypothetical protein